MGGRFVHLGIAGFKSFAEQVSLDILPGLTGVIGPNGCGKSNVAEALRWAMGEASARHLRGGEMDDVIFSGTASRASRNLAEVSLTIEDDGQGLPPPFANQPTLQVVRRLERGVGSAYRVNGHEVRARDVNTLFADLASGSRSSAMVSQGRVGNLINARPDERRLLLEEAAGITGLGARRAEAETRLRGAEGNLQRAAERQELIERQLAVLRNQAREAARYRTVMGAVLVAEAALLALRRARALAAQASAAAELDAASAALACLVAEAATAEGKAATLRASLPRDAEQEASARALLERARLSRESLATKSADAHAALEAASKRQAQIARDLAHAEAVVADARTQDLRLASEAEGLQRWLRDIPGALQLAETEAEAAEAALAVADREAGVAAAAMAEAAARAEASLAILQGAEARARRALDASTRLESEHARLAGQRVDPEALVAAEARRAAAEQALKDGRAAQQRAETERSRAAAASGAARDEHSRLDLQRHRLAAETMALAELLAVGDGERWPPLLDRVDVPSGLEAALGAALGDGLTAAADVQAARHWRPMPAAPESPLPAPRLSSFVSGPALLARALSATGVVDSEQEGDRHQPALLPGQSLVSAAGAVWRWDGYVVRAGAPTVAGVRLQQRNRLVQLRAGLAEAERQADAAGSDRKVAAARERDASAGEQQARVRVRECEVEAERARVACQALRERAAAVFSQIASVTGQLAGLAPEAEAAREAAAAARLGHAALPEQPALRLVAASTREAVTEARRAEVRARHTLEDLRHSGRSGEARLAVIAAEREDRRMRVADLASRVVDLRARVEDAEAERANLAAVPGRLAEQVLTQDAATAAALREHQMAVARRDAAQRASIEADEAGRVATHAVSAARETLVRAEMAAAAAHDAVVACESAIAERADALPPLLIPDVISADAEDRARQRLQRLTRERDDVGAVNLCAEAEVIVAEAEATAFQREREELVTSIAKLRGSVGHLNRQSRERLAEVFQQIDRRFQALFSRMFGGGRAHLALVGSDDLLEAGLEIFAQPPGKKLAKLSLLSGGEQALTALCLVFAVFACNPAPLCVLDEVDAPLDDANVERLCMLLAEMAAETGTRFVVITHHQVTMARMDRLYGITMQERGISRLLSVNLAQAIESPGEAIRSIAAE